MRMSGDEVQAPELLALRDSGNLLESRIGQLHKSTNSHPSNTYSSHDYWIEFT